MTDDDMYIRYRNMSTSKLYGIRAQFTEHLKKHPNESSLVAKALGIVRIVIAERIGQK